MGVAWLLGVRNIPITGRTRGENLLSTEIKSGALISITLTGMSHCLHRDAQRITVYLLDIAVLTSFNVIVIYDDDDDSR